VVPKLATDKPLPTLSAHTWSRKMSRTKTPIVISFPTSPLGLMTCAGHAQE